MSPHFILVHVVAALLTVGTASVRADDPTPSAGTSDAGTSDAAGAAGAAANDAPAAPSIEAPPAARSRQVCHMERPVGSNLDQRVCRTEAVTREARDRALESVERVKEINNGR